MLKTIRSILGLLVLLYAAWLLMMLVHEAGHVLGAIATGGHVVRVVWGPISLSRTDVFPNPHPQIVTWAGPLFGAVAPRLIDLIYPRRRRGKAFVTFLAAFCLIVNGTYLAVGAFFPAGDARDLLHFGTSKWVLVAVGVPMSVAGLWPLHYATVK